MKMVRETLATAVICGLYIGTASMPAGSASVKDQIIVGEATHLKRVTPSPLGTRGKVDQSGTALAARSATNYKPSRLYADGVVEGPESCILGDPLNIGGGHTGGAGR
jgi:hypothetical protein